MSDYGSRGYGSDPEGYGWSGSDPGREDRGNRDDYGYHDSGRDRRYRDYDDEPRHAPRGSASVSGSASVGSASVSSPHDEPATTGRARVPGDSAGTGRARGSARVGGKRRPGGPLSEEEAAALKKAKKKKKRRRIYIALGCVIVMMLGVVTVVGSVFFESVELSSDIDKDLDLNSTVMYSGGEEMGSIGTQKRIPIKIGDLPDEVTWALVAGEDKNFYEHSGVDFWGVMRAIWNNVTGGATQGASTLTQQYVGTVLDLRNDHSYMRKAKEAVMAMKMDDRYTKKQILEHYLNLVYMGRGAYGLGAAAQAWFAKEAKDLTASEAALIFTQVKQPDGTYDPLDPLGIGEETAIANATGRWTYILDSMTEMGKLSKTQRAEYTELPETNTEYQTDANFGFNTDTGFVSHRYALQEAAEILGVSTDDIGIGGYTITTTIDKKLQTAAVAAADWETEGSILDGQDDNLRAAIVSVDPKNGAILAYYGGTKDGTGTDKAGYDSMHPPGSSFKEFTMLAAIEAGMSTESLWDGTSPRKFPERESDVVNAGNTSVKKISMKQAIIDSLNTPIYAMTNTVGAATVAQLAADMGITRLVDPGRTDENGAPLIIDLTQEGLLDPNNPRDVVDNEIGFGQYPVAVRDMAVANATLAAEGVYHKPHFIQKITDKDGELVYDASEPGTIPSKSVLNRDVALNGTAVAKNIHPAGSDGVINGIQQFAGKTGTWERYCDDGCDQNSAIWYAGYTPELSAAVWVGDKENENGVVQLSDGSPGYGANLSGWIWERYMEKAYELMEYQPVAFADAPPYGDPNRGELGDGTSADDDKDDDDGDDDGGEEENPDDPSIPENPDCDPASPTADCNNDGICDNFPDDPNCVPTPPGTDEGHDYQPPVRYVVPVHEPQSVGHQLAVREPRQYMLTR